MQAEAIIVLQKQAARLADKQKLDAFQQNVKKRATRIQKEMRMVKLEWKREVRAIAQVGYDLVLTCSLHCKADCVSRPCSCCTS